MKFGVNKNILSLVAGAIWIIAGLNILRIGILTWIVDSTSWMFKLLDASLVFLFFFGFIFDKIYKKYLDRISRKHDGLHCPFSFFDKKGLAMMVFMIVLGITLRHFQLLPMSFFSFFYSGLGVALFFTGIRFLFFRLKSKQK